MHPSLLQLHLLPYTKRLIIPWLSIRQVIFIYSRGFFVAITTELHQGNRMGCSSRAAGAERCRPGAGAEPTRPPPRHKRQGGRAGVPWGARRQPPGQTCSSASPAPHSTHPRLSHGRSPRHVLAPLGGTGGL